MSFEKDLQNKADSFVTDYLKKNWHVEEEIYPFVHTAATQIFLAGASHIQAQMDAEIVHLTALQKETAQICFDVTQEKQALEQRVKELEAESKQLKEVFQRQCEELRAVIQEFDDGRYAGYRLSETLILEYRKLKAENAELKRKGQNE